MPRSTDTNIGPYHLDTLIGSGDTGDVYKATDTGLNRTVAIKVFKDKDADRGRHWLSLHSASALDSCSTIYDVEITTAFANGP